MESVFAAVVGRSVAMSALILAYLAVTPLLARRYAAKWRYYAWLVIALGLVIPYRPPVEAALVHVDALAAPRSAPAAPAPVAGIDGPAATAPAPDKPLSPSGSWAKRASGLWLAGAAAFMAFQVFRHYRFVRTARRWSEDVADRRLLRLLRDLKDELGIRRSVAVRVCDCVSVPMLVGFFRPAVLLPRAILAFGPASEETALILKHELVHLKRRDMWHKGLMMLAAAVHWFNPAVHLMARAASALCEMSCDERVLQGADFRQRKRYCETILRAVRCGNQPGTAFSTHFIGGKRSMKNRIQSVLDTADKKAGFAVLAVVLAATVLAAAAFDNRSPAEAGRADVEAAGEEAGLSENSMAPYAPFLDSVSNLFYYDGRWVRSLYDEIPGGRSVLYFRAVEDHEVEGKQPVHLRAIRNPGTGGIERLAEMSEREAFDLMENDQVETFVMHPPAQDLPPAADAGSAMEGGSIETKDGQNLSVRLAGGASVQFGELAFRKGETFELSASGEAERPLKLGIVSISTGQVYGDLVETGTGTVSLAIPEDGEYRIYVGNEASAPAVFELRLSRAIDGPIA